MKRQKIDSKFGCRVIALLVAPWLGLHAGSVAGAPGGGIVIAAPLLIQNFDPTNHQAASDYLTHSMLFDGLLNLGAKGKEPALATDWKVSDDKLVIEFNLRRGIRFHNGDEFTGEDVQFTFHRILSPESTHNGRKPIVAALDRVEVMDPYKVRFHLKKTWAEFFTSVRAGGTQAIVPKNYYEKVGDKGFQQSPVGTGPFKLSALQEGEFTKFEANDDYWGQVASVKFVTQRLVAEPFTRYAMLERGEADIIMGITGPLLENIKSSDKLNTVSTRYSGTSIIGFNRQTNPEYKDVRVRMAVAHAIDRQAIADTILGGVCEPASHIFTPGTFGHEESIEAVPYDPEKAKQLLAEAGIGDGYETDFSMHTQSFGSLPNAPAVLEAIAGYLEAVGLKLNRIPRETGAWLENMRAGKQSGIFYGPNSVPDDGGTLLGEWYSYRAWCGEPCNVMVKEYDEITDAVAVETDIQKREQMLKDWARMDRDRLEHLPLFWCSTPFGITQSITGWSPGLLSAYHQNLQSVETAK